MLCCERYWASCRGGGEVCVNVGSGGECCFGVFVVLPIMVLVDGIDSEHVLHELEDMCLKMSGGEAEARLKWGQVEATS